MSMNYLRFIPAPLSDKRAGGANMNEGIIRFFFLFWERERVYFRGSSLSSAPETIRVIEPPGNFASQNVVIYTQTRKIGYIARILCL